VHVNEVCADTRLMLVNTAFYFIRISEFYCEKLLKVITL